MFDMQGAQTEGSRRRGIGRYTQDLMQALMSSAKGGEDIYLAWNKTLEPPSGILSMPNSGSKRLFSAPYGALKRGRFENNLFDLQHEVNDCLFRYNLALSRCEHILFSSLMETDDVDFVLPRNLNFGPLASSYAIVYDIIPLLFKEGYIPTAGFDDKYQAHLNVKMSADILFAISEKTKSDLVSILGVDSERVVTIGTGIDLNRFLGAKTSRHVFFEKFGITRQFLFFLGGDEFRKNMTGMVKALLVLPPHRRNTLQLLIAGKVQPEKKSIIGDMIHRAGLPGDAIIFADFISEEDLRQAYESCAMTVIPSVYEGFGLPVLEAMASNAAVIASDNSSMSEILTNEAFLFNAHDYTDIASRIEFVLDHPDVVARLKTSYKNILSSYTWERVVERIFETFDSVDMSRQGNRRRSERQFYSPRSIDFVFSGKPSNVWVDTLLSISRNDNIDVFAAEDHLPHIDLPCRLNAPNLLRRRLVKNTPIIILVSDLTVLCNLAMDIPLQDSLIIFDAAVMEELQCYLTRDKSIGKGSREHIDVKKLLRRLNTAYSIQLHQADTFTPLSISESSVDTLGPISIRTAEKQNSNPAVVKSFIDTELDHYTYAHPYWAAQPIRDILRRYGKTNALSRRISALASISLFETCELLRS
jgi:glycosyltransferase involved in cell wall biosynthesis